MLYVLRTVKATTIPLHQRKSQKKSHSSQNFIAITIMVVEISGLHYTIGELNSQAKIVLKLLR